MQKPKKNLKKISWYQMIQNCIIRREMATKKISAENSGFRRLLNCRFFQFYRSRQTHSILRIFFKNRLLSSKLRLIWLSIIFLTENVTFPPPLDSIVIFFIKNKWQLVFTEYLQPNFPCKYIPLHLIKFSSIVN